MTDFTHRPVLRYDTAARMVAEAVRAARARGLEVAVSVVDAAGHLLAFGRTDNAPLPRHDRSLERAQEALGAGRAAPAGEATAPASRVSEQPNGRSGPACPIHRASGGAALAVDGLVAGALGIDGPNGEHLGWLLHRVVETVPDAWSCRG